MWFKICLILVVIGATAASYRHGANYHHDHPIGTRDIQNSRKGGNTIQHPKKCACISKKIAGPYGNNGHIPINHWKHYVNYETRDIQNSRKGGNTIRFGKNVC
jgi:hypothetical protein